MSYYVHLLVLPNIQGILLYIPCWSGSVADLKWLLTTCAHSENHKATVFYPVFRDPMGWMIVLVRCDQRKRGRYNNLTSCYNHRYCGTLEITSNHIQQTNTAKWQPFCFSVNENYLYSIEYKNPKPTGFQKLDCVVHKEKRRAIGPYYLFVYQSVWAV